MRDFDAIAAELLRKLKRVFGARQGVLCRLPELILRDPDRYGDAKPELHIGFADSLSETFRCSGCLLEIRIRDQERETVSVVTTEIEFAHFSHCCGQVEPNSIRDLNENVITRLLAVLMINVLELIGVDKANGKDSSTGVRSCRPVDDLVKKRLAG